MTFPLAKIVVNKAVSAITSLSAVRKIKNAKHIQSWDEGHTSQVAGPNIKEAHFGAETSGG
jgi:hypothetical protein